MDVAMCRQPTQVGTSCMACLNLTCATFQRRLGGMQFYADPSQISLLKSVPKILSQIVPCAVQAGDIMSACYVALASGGGHRHGDLHAYVCSLHRESMCVVADCNLK